VESVHTAASKRLAIRYRIAVSVALGQRYALITTFVRIVQTVLSTYIERQKSSFAVYRIFFNRFKESCDAEDQRRYAKYWINKRYNT
jgi:hypothetical protein